MKISNMKLELATITWVSKPTSDTADTQLQISFQTETQTHSLICSSLFSNHSKFGQIFLATTGIKPNQFGGSAPNQATIGRQCQIIIQDVDSEFRVIDVLPVPSPQLELGLKFEAD